MLSSMLEDGGGRAGSSKGSGSISLCGDVSTGGRGASSISWVPW